VHLALPPCIDVSKKLLFVSSHGRKAIFSVLSMTHIHHIRMLLHTLRFDSRVRHRKLTKLQTNFMVSVLFIWYLSFSVLSQYLQIKYTDCSIRILNLFCHSEG
jgi:TRAP-type uncharacterized transport system fused permease subunit